MQGEEFHNAFGIIDGALRQVRRRILAVIMARAGLRLLAALAGALLLMLLLERVWYLPGGGRLILISAIGLGLVGLLAQAAWRAWRRCGRLTEIACLADRSLPELKNRLESALEFSRGAFDSREIYSPELVEASVVQTARTVSRPGLLDSLTDKLLVADRRSGRLEGYLAAGLTVICLISGIFDPLLLRQVYQGYRNPLETIRRERAFRIYVQPGDVTMLRGEPLTVRAIGSIHRPDGMQLRLWQIGKVSETRSMDYLRDQFEYRLDLGPVQNDLSYLVSQGGTVTDTFRVHVASNPFVTELRLRYEYPSYTGLPPYETARDKAIQGLRGARVILSGRASNPLASGSLVLDSDSLRPLSLDSERGFVDTLRLVRDGHYRFALVDRWGLANTDTLAYPIAVAPDEPPAVALLFPEKEARLDADMQKPLMYEAADDFGLSRLVLSYRVEKTGRRDSLERSLALPLPAGRVPHVMDRYNWELGKLNLLPGESVLYRLTAWDNDRVSGPKSTSTGEHRLKFPSLKEIFESGEKQQDEIASTLKSLGREGQKSLDQVKKMQEALQRGQDMDWQKKQQLSQALDRQKQIAEQVSKLSDKMQQSIDQLKRGEAMSPELLDKLARVQKLMQEVATDQMKELMAKIQSSLENMDRKTLAEEMEKLKFSQEKFLEKLDKTLSVLEKLKLEQQMDFLVNRTSELSRAAAMLSDSNFARAVPGEEKAGDDSSAAEAGRKDKAGSPAREIPLEQVNQPSDSSAAKASSEDAQAGGPESGDSSGTGTAESNPALEKELALKDGREAVSQMKDLTEDVFKRMQEASGNLDKAGEKEMSDSLKKDSEGADRKYLSDSWDAAGQNVENGRLGQAARNQRQAGKKLDQMHQKMKKYAQELKDKWKEEVAEAMRRAFDDLDYLSHRQEAISEAVKAEPDINHPDVLKLAAEQQEVVRGLATVEQGLADAARDNFFISGRLLEIVDAAAGRGINTAEQLSAEQRNRDQSVSAATGTLAAINAGMLSLLDDRNGMQQSNSGIGMDQMLKRMQELAKRQEELNRKSRQQSQGQSGQEGGMGGGTGLPSPQSSGRDMGEMLRQMAAEQKAIQEQLAQLAQQAGQGGESGQLKNALEGMSKEADEVAKEMLERGVTPETLERQNRLLDRLLSAQNSIQRRDTESSERKAEAAKSYMPVPPPALDPALLKAGENDVELRQLLEKWKGTYPESYEAVIRAYYERLRTQNLWKDSESGKKK